MNLTILYIFFAAYFIHILFTLYYAYFKNHGLFFGLSLGFVPILGPLIINMTESKTLQSKSRRDKFTTGNNFWIYGMQIVLVIGVAIFFLMFFERGTTRFDFTKDKRYSLDETTIELLNELGETNEQLIVKYYYSPSELRPRRLQLMPKEIEDLLKEFEEVAPRNFVFEMIEVPQIQLSEEGAKEEEKKDYYDAVLGSEGIESKNDAEIDEDATDDEKEAFKIREFLKDEKINDIREMTYESDKKTYQSFYSAVYITYGYKKPFKFDQLYVTEAAQKTGASVYAYANVILTKALRQLIKKPLQIGFLTGHDEKHYTFETTKMMRQYLRENEGFEDQIVDLKHGSVAVPGNIDVLIMHATTDRLNEREQFQLDQYIMRGGKILFFTAPLIPPSDTRNQYAPWSKADDSWTTFINKYGFKVDSDEVAFDEECIVGGGRAGNEPWSFALKIEGDRLTNHPICAGITNIMLVYNNIIAENTANPQPNAKFEPIFHSSNKAWSVTLDNDVRDNPLLIHPWTDVIEGLMQNPPAKRDKYVLAASVSGQFKSAYKQGNTPRWVDEEGKELVSPETESKRKTEPVLSTSPDDARIVVIGNSLSYLYWTMQGDTLKSISNSINYLGNGDAYLNIEKKTSTFTPLEQVSRDKKTLIRVIVIGAMPILLILLGFFLLIYRIQSRYYDQAVFELRKKQRLAADTSKDVVTIEEPNTNNQQ